MKNPQEDPKVLRKRIEELEKKLVTQSRLIAILRTFPGNKGVKLPDEEQVPSPAAGQGKKKIQGGKRRGRKPRGEKEKQRNEALPAVAHTEDRSVDRAGEAEAKPRDNGAGSGGNESNAL